MALGELAIGGLLRVSGDLAVAYCGACGADNAAAQAYCGACGVAMTSAGRERPGVRRADRRGYAGPWRLLVVGAVALAVGGAMAVAAFSVVQSQGASSFAFVLDVARPAINSGFRAVGAEEIQAPETGDGASPIVVAGLVVGSTVAALGFCLLAMGVVWTLVRWSPRERVRGAYSSAQPITSSAVDQGKRQAVSAAGLARRGALRASPVVARALQGARNKVTGRNDGPASTPNRELPAASPDRHATRDRDES